jgi:hypothetical protein
MHQDAFTHGGGRAPGPVQDQVIIQRAELAVAKGRAIAFGSRSSQAIENAS